MHHGLMATAHKIAANLLFFSSSIRPRSIRISLHIRSFSSQSREWSTPLAKSLAEAIQTTGPISVAAYMRQCLTAPDGGYYTSRRGLRDRDDRDDRDWNPFGKRGDFVTAPELSQVFGELLGVWLVTVWMAQGKKGRGIEIVELGPGRGTLMDDMLRTVSNYRPLAESVDAIRLVEASPMLRDAQKKLLCGDGAAMEETETGFRSTSKYGGVPVTWTENLRSVPERKETSPFIFAHEFFDALPVHAFQSVPPAAAAAAAASATQSTLMTPTGPVTPRHNAASTSPQWRELLVSTKSQPGRPEEEEFQLSVAKASTPSSLVMPEFSERYKALKGIAGSTIEISPDSLSYAQEIAHRIGGPNPGRGRRPPPVKAPSGAALIIDYGTSSTVPINSLRGIRNHHRVSPFSSPGFVDISADVDFTALAEAALNASPGVEVYGPVEQAEFLQALGIAERARQLMKRTDNADTRSILETATQRLVEKGGGGMGRIYKAMAIVPESGGIKRPVGFGGRVTD